MKGYTDLEQSKKLAEILPLKSADMRFCFSHTLGGRIRGHYPMIGREPSSGTIPCWSLAALLNIPEQTALFKTSLGWVCKTYIGQKVIDLNTYYDCALDACYEMILKLHELNLL